MIDWFQEFTDDGEWRLPKYPARVPRGGVKKYFWNWKCLEAPKPYFDSEGYYYWRDYLIRKVVPGLLSIPKPIATLPQARELASVFKSLIDNYSRGLNAIHN